MKKNYINETYELFKHCSRVSELAYKVAKELKLDELTCQEIAIAGALHDIGKLKLNQDILNKKGKLTKLEWEHVKTHTLLSYEIIKELHITDFALETIKQHHEDMKGSGYPNRLKGTEINIGARILKVCDVFDALIMDRPYRKGYTQFEALKIMRNDIELYDVNVFKSLVRVFSNNTVELENKEGIV